MKNLSDMNISEIAQVVYRDWKTIYFGAAPYLIAMASLDSIHDYYGGDPGKSIVLYFLANAQTWRGEVARKVKAELNKRIKAK